MSRIRQDDADLYQNLLKELIEAGMSDQQDGQRGNQWLVAAQQRHKSKLHRKVDRKASKGRKTVRLTARKSPGTHYIASGAVLLGCAEIYTLSTMVLEQRYTIMQELVNFMAPVSTGADGQHDDDDDDRVDVSRLLVGNLFRSV